MTGGLRWNYVGFVGWILMGYVECCTEKTHVWKNLFWYLFVFMGMDKIRRDLLTFFKNNKHFC